MHVPCMGACDEQGGLGLVGRFSMTYYALCDEESRVT